MINENDNCPRIRNTNQADYNGDGKGNLCEMAERYGVHLNHPNVRASLNWLVEDLVEDYPAQVLNFSDWDPDMVALLYQYLWDFEQHNDIQMELPPEQEQTLRCSNSGMGKFSESLAKQYYLATVARSLYVDKNQIVPWSILSNDYEKPILSSAWQIIWEEGATVLYGLLDARSMLDKRVVNLYEFRRNVMIDHDPFFLLDYVLGDHRSPYLPQDSFIDRNGANSADNRRLTLANMAYFASRFKHIHHGSSNTARIPGVDEVRCDDGSVPNSGTGEFWQLYYGPKRTPTVEDVLGGVIFFADNFDRFPIQGCFGSSALMNSMLNVVNIPSMIESTVVNEEDSVHTGLSVYLIEQDPIHLPHGDNLNDSDNPSNRNFLRPVDHGKVYASEDDSGSMLPGGVGAFVSDEWYQLYHSIETRGTFVGFDQAHFKYFIQRSMNSPNIYHLSRRCQELEACGWPVDSTSCPFAIDEISQIWGTTYQAQYMESIDAILFDHFDNHSSNACDVVRSAQYVNSAGSMLEFGSTRATWYWVDGELIQVPEIP